MAYMTLRGQGSACTRLKIKKLGTLGPFVGTLPTFRGPCQHYKKAQDLTVRFAEMRVVV